MPAPRAAGLPRRSSTSARRSGPSASALAERLRRRGHLGVGRARAGDRSHDARRGAAHGDRRTASSRARETRWIVERISVAWTTARRSSARVSASRSKPVSRDHSPTYIDGAYCAWMPPTRSSARGRLASERSSSRWRASTARLSSRVVRTRGRRAATATGAAARRPAATSASAASITMNGSIGVRYRGVSITRNTTLRYMRAGNAQTNHGVRRARRVNAPATASSANSQKQRTPRIAQVASMLTVAPCARAQSMPSRSRPRTVVQNATGRRSAGWSSA